MIFDRVEIPYGAYWSTPFAKRQGRLQHLHSLKLDFGQHRCAETRVNRQGEDRHPGESGAAGSR